MPLPQLVYAPRGFINSADPLLLETEQIIRHARPGLTAEELAKMLNLSERTMHRRFKKLPNESPKELITRVRIETACVLLQTPKQVALKCGYNEDTSFRRAFIQLTGMTPADYKRRSKAQSSDASG
ncbi:AraC family transcriptional regulator [Pseudomonas savastanoi pv. glycinea]|uniref:AraC family transcriptional regulator n=1 Tax=Pseudomonas savastanoi pv. glycinea TaxID=318 RepID=A0A0P9VAE5_PSESG|nr:helix-turn-helix transcriptional regulator [Pseudomonas savastanoi]KPX35964.1 AraC family transcriptional regulator [Pseudomonas savastanoi pv. glycinea]MCQ3004843.1 helix-turn-helix transcriptional regulator [Pseudomonas savastanoi]PYD23236.1 AraC family transcriptional regulator [Pseudomonas savastanoi pv. glycinea]RMM83319.1 AraC family transcriptional regulator [Pseudomonas savastanoi pv. glycinea]RMM94788.1 Transcriptional regulator, AraC family [Pseudomonas savastanoi pv. glycinea]